MNEEKWWEIEVEDGSTRWVKLSGFEQKRLENGRIQVTFADGQKGLFVEEPNAIYAWFKDRKNIEEDEPEDPLEQLKKIWGIED